MSCAPSTGLYLADLETPATKQFAKAVETRCGKVRPVLPELHRDLSEGEVAKFITRQGAVSIECRDAALAYVAHVRSVDRSLRKGERAG